MESPEEYLIKKEKQYFSRNEVEKAMVALFYKVSDLLDKINEIDKDNRLNRNL